MIKVSDELDQVVVAKTYEAEQDHVFRFWGQLSAEQQRELLDQLADVDFQLLRRLTLLVDRAAPPAQTLSPIEPLVLSGERRAELAALGEEALRAGKVALLMVAGGQGTRLGWSGPKGTYPIGPVSEKSLFELFAEQIRALEGRAERKLPWLVLTSRQNRAETEAFFADHGHFGLDAAQVTFLVQRELPATDFRGRLILEAPSRIASSPNGHGGALQALFESNALERLGAEGVETIFYWQVDNPLCPVADPVFLGAHLEAQAEASTKVVKKTDPAEKLGLVVERAGRPAVVEYSEMSAEQQEERVEGSGELAFRAGNIAVHLFQRAFLERVHADHELEYHVARKKVRCIDEQGEPVEPAEPNACKFELFVFDVLPMAKRHLTLEVSRADEFEPLKNATGDNSPETVKRALSERFARWLEQAGFPPARDAAGALEHRYEISPLTAQDAASLAEALGEGGPPEPQDGGVSL